MRRTTLLGGIALILAVWAGGATAVRAASSGENGRIVFANHGPGGAVEWAGFAGNAQHTAVARERSQPFRRIRWRAKVDLAPVLLGGVLPIHYGSPMITAANTVLVPTRVSEQGRIPGGRVLRDQRRPALVNQD